MTKDEVFKLAELVERADLIMLVFGEKKAGLGPDMQKQIVIALREFAEGESVLP